MTTPNATFAVRDEPTIRDALLRTVSNSFEQHGLPTPNTLPGSELYIRATAFARQLTVTESNGVVSVNAQMPDSALGTFLQRWLALLGFAQRPAGGSSGNVTISCTQDATVPVNSLLVDGAGFRFSVQVGGVYADSSQVPVKAVDGGVSTDHVNGDQLRWLSPPPFCAPNVVVGLPGGGDGLVGGVDAEDPETARSRMLLRFKNPMGGGDWTTIALLCTDSTPVVQQGFVYPAANGPATVHVAVVRYTSSLAASNARYRDVDSATMNSTVIPYVTGKVFEAAQLVVTTVQNQAVDVSLGLNLPSSPSASPPGPGGGWVDGQPWPYNSTGASNFRCRVTSVTTSTILVVDAPTSPVPNVSHVAWLDPATWKLNLAIVVAVSGTSGAYVITLDTPWVNATTSLATFGSMYVFPQSVNQVAYVDALLGAFAAMGPGEKTNAAGLISRASRKPLPSSTFPYSLGNQLLQAVTDSDSIIAATSYLYRSATTPNLPASINDAPYCLVPRNLAFYAAL